FWDAQKGACLGGRTSDGERDRDDPIEENWRKQERAKELAESKRVFYVALTRAKERLVLVHPKLEDKNLAKISSETAFSEAYWRGWLECASVKPVLLPQDALSLPIVREPPNVEPFQASDPLPKPRSIRPRHSVTEWSLLSRCERAYEWTYARPKVLAEGL